MVMLIRTISLFLVIIIFREGKGRFVGGLGPLRPGNKKLGLKSKNQTKGNRILRR